MPNKSPLSLITHGRAACHAVKTLQFLPRRVHLGVHQAEPSAVLLGVLPQQHHGGGQLGLLVGKLGGATAW